MSFTFREIGFAWPGAAPLFSDISLSIAPGERMAILGGNGSGKSTLGRCLAGQLPCAGAALWQGQPLAAMSRARRAALVQSVAQRPHLQLAGRGTVRDEVAFGPENLCLPAPEIAARTARAMAQLGLTGLATREPAHLSGGQLQRVALAAALAMRPALLVLDEPMTDLDAESRARLAGHLAVPDMAVIVLDVGWFGWMDGLIDRALTLDGGRLSAPIPAAGIARADLPPRIVRPDGAP